MEPQLCRLTTFVNETNLSENKYKIMKSLLDEIFDECHISNVILTYLYKNIFTENKIYSLYQTGKQLTYFFNESKFLEETANIHEFIKRKKKIKTSFKKKSNAKIKLKLK